MKTTAKLFACLVLTGLGVGGLAQDASAAKRRRAPVEPIVTSSGVETIPLTVNRRSWLDPGNASSTTGTLGPSYVAANTALNRTQDRIFAPDGFGNAEIRNNPLDVPGRSQPLVEGSSLPNGQIVVDNVLLPQNYYFNPAPDLPFGR